VTLHALVSDVVTGLEDPALHCRVRNDGWVGTDTHWEQTSNKDGLVQDKGKVLRKRERVYWRKNTFVKILQL